MIGIGFDLNDILGDILPRIDIINIENPLYTNYLNGNYQEDANRFLNYNYSKKVICDGAYIDLNPGTGEKEILEIVRKKVYQSIEFAKSINSEEIIFLSTFLPMIQLEFYTKTHIHNSIAFWKEIMAKTKDIRVSICNTFEYNPDIIISIVKGVNNEHFGLAFDIGHAFAFGKVSLRQFFIAMEPLCKTVYIHSNRKTGDKHLNIFEGDLINSQEFKEIIPLLKNKNMLLKPFDKSRLNENIDLLKQII